MIDKTTFEQVDNNTVKVLVFIQGWDKAEPDQVGVIRKCWASSQWKFTGNVFVKDFRCNSLEEVKKRLQRKVPRTFRGLGKRRVRK